MKAMLQILQKRFFSNDTYAIYYLKEVVFVLQASLVAIFTC